MMKETLRILAMAALLLPTLLFTSCDDDQQVAMMLWGTWEGQVSTEFYRGRWGSYDSDYYTVWYFEGKPGARNGRGWEQNYLGTRRYRDYFDWYVRDDGNTIEIHYHDSSQPVRYIYHFHISDMRFRGEVDNGNGAYSSFSLYKAEDHGYNGYNHYYGWRRWAKPAATLGETSWKD